MFFIRIERCSAINRLVSANSTKGGPLGAMSTRPEDLEVELRDVILVLKDVAGTQWYDLGLQLRLSPSILDTIAAHNNVDDHKRMMLRKWLQIDPRVL